MDGKKWNGVFYDKESDRLFPIKNGNGKVKEYNENGDLIFEGEYLNGKMWNGKLREYLGSVFYVFRDRGYCSCYTNMFFERKGIIEKVKEYKNILKFEGEYLYGKRSGKGKEYDINGKLIFEGEYHNNAKVTDNQ